MSSFKPNEYKIKAKTKTTAKAGAEILLERGVTKCVYLYQIKSNHPIRNDSKNEKTFVVLLTLLIIRAKAVLIVAF